MRISSLIALFCLALAGCATSGLDQAGLSRALPKQETTLYLEPLRSVWIDRRHADHYMCVGGDTTYRPVCYGSSTWKARCVCTPIL